MKKSVVFSMIAASLLGLVKIISIIPFNRLAADDFSFASTAMKEGFWHAQYSWYIGITGRFTSSFLQTLFSLMSGEGGKAIIYSLITFGCLFLAFVVVFKNLLGQKIWSFYVLLFSCLSFVTFYFITPNKAESWYWITGSVTYLWPIIFLIFASSFLLKKNNVKIDHLFAFILTFIAVGGNETIALLINIFLLSVVVYMFFIKKIKKIYITALIASVLSFSLMYFSPGNANRLSGGGSDPMSILGSILYSIQYSQSQLLSIIGHNIISLISLLISTAYLFSQIIIYTNLSRSIESLFSRIFVTICIPVVLSVIYLLPAFKSLGRIPPDRVDVSLSFIVLCSIIGVAYYLGQIFVLSKLDKFNLYKLLICVFSFLLFVSSFKITSTLGWDFYTAKNYSSTFDEMVIQLKNASDSNTKKSVIVSELPESGLITSIQLQYDWVRAAVSGYYKVAGITYK